MVSGTRPDGGGGQVISVRIRRTIQSIREIVGNHSDADIYAVLKETNMDPNETAQKLLNQDPFHEVRRKRDKRKELSGFKLAVDSKKHTESMHWEKSNRSMDFNARRGGFTRSYVPDTRINREFRVVRDNRVNQNLNKDAKSELSQHSSGNEQVKSNISEKRLTGVLNDKKLSNSGILDSHGISKDMNVLNHENDLDPVGRRRALLPEEIRTITQSTSSDPQSVVPNSSLINASFSTNSAIGMYSSSSDPVHVPSPASRSAGTVGAIRREVGAVGLKKHSSGVQGTKSVVSNDSHSAPFTGKVILLTESIELSGDLTTNTKSSQLNHVPMPDTIVPTTSNSRAAVQYSSKQHLQIFSHQRAMQPNMEWKPKSQKIKTDSSSTTETSSIFPSSNGNSFSSNLVDTIDLSHKLSDVHIHGDQHVIIPLHLRVPESECTQFTFGSFGAEFDTGKGFISTNQAIESVEQSKVEPSGSNSASVPVETNDEISAKVGHLVDCQSGISSRSTSLASAEELERPSSGSNEPLDPQNIENYADIGLVGSHSPPYSSQQSQRMQDMTNMPNFSGSSPNHLTYNSQVGYATPFFQTTLEDNVRGQILACTPETICSHATSSNSSTAVAITQQQYPASQQQQQAVAQLYPQVHIPHYPNFMPYRHIFSPVYVPPMAMPNYSSNPAFAHPTNGNNYLLMAGGGSHLPAGGMKYAPSQYKPLPAGSPTAYGNYPSPAAFGISTPSAVGATGLDELTRIKYKDNNIYVPNQQAEAPDMWIQTPRELPGLQSTPYYNLSGHAAHPTAFVSAHAAAAAAAASGHAPFNAVAAAAQPSPVQYPTMYHPPQPASIAGPQHLIHQQVASAVGVATAGGPQVGTFQQSQLGRLNWTASF